MKISLFTLALIFLSIHCVAKSVDDAFVEKLEPYIENEQYAKTYELTLPFAMDGSHKAQYFLSLMYATGTHVKQSPEEAFFWMNKAGDSDNVEISYTLATYLYHGFGTSIDIPNSILHFTKAAKKGHTESMLYLVDILKNGDGTKIDEVQSNYWLIVAAEQNNWKAQKHLAISYINGAIGYVDYDKAVFWFEKAHQQNQTDSLKKLLSFAKKLAAQQ